MRSNYKRIGDYIRLLDERNTGLRVNNLLGLSISKEFIPSVANIIGSDMENYKIIRKNQFACSTMQVRRDKKIPVALLQEVDEAIISQAYPVFEITNTNELLPEYLMMWFTRQEFDREACFYAIGGVRGSLEWDDFCDMKLPIPNLDKQKEIIKKYNTIVNRIDVNNQLIQKLEETAQAIYKQWFVDFEFPDDNGNLYKSSGGEMVFNEELNIEFPKHWHFGTLNNTVDLFISNRGKSKNIINLSAKDITYKFPVISAMNINNGKIVRHNSIMFADIDDYSGWMKVPLLNEDVLLTSEAPLGEVLYITKRTNFILSQRLYGLRVNKNESRGTFLFFWLQSQLAKRELESRSTGTTVMGIKLSELKRLPILKPDIELINLFHNAIQYLLQFNEEKQLENEILEELQKILLSKLATIEN